MWYWVLNIAIALWVFFDARSRKMDKPVLWAIGTCLLMIVVIPFYFAKRSLKAGEVREGGTGWNVTKSFAIFWTLFMFIAGVTDGTAMGIGMIFGLWFVVIVGAFVIGLFLKKSSIVEKGPTGALALGTRQPEQLH